ncbi:MAG: sigma-70 family RNA polymerase sigma factor [Anaerobacillus sp.]|uniref:sigma-70 family RNA polymerase sigma factor n=1 Tax=Anaerobacillus sp. TaxID=1872506 RepID=UPI00391A1285
MNNLDYQDRGEPVDKDAWLEEVMDEYAERLTKLAYNYLKDWSMAQDVVQEVFVTCYEQFEIIDTIRSLKAWLFRITINKCKDVLRSSLFKKVVVNSNLFSLFTTRDLSPEMNLIKRDEDETLSMCVLSLPIKYREIIILFYYEELSIEEISEMLKLNSNTVKTRLNRGRMKLKNVIEGGELNGK